MKVVKVRHKLFKNFIIPFVRLFFFIKRDFKCEKKYKFKKGENAIILSNHQTDFDPIYLSVSFNRSIYFVCTDSVFSHKISGKLLKFLFAPIPKKKGFNDPQCIRGLFKVAKEKGCIGLFPEGNRTIAEFQFYMGIELAKLVRSLKIPLIIYNIEGGFGSYPRFSIKRRKGHLTGKVVAKYEVEDIAKLTDEELLKIIKDGLKVYDSENGYHYNSNTRAEYLERFFFICPKCQATHKLISNGNYLTCSNCNLKVEYTTDLKLKSDDNNFKFTRLVDWYDYQKEWIKNYDYNNDNIIFKDDEVKLYLTYRDKPRELIEEGTLILTSKSLKINDRVIETKDIVISSVLGGFKFNFTANNIDYLVIGNKRFNALKYTLMFNRIDTKMKIDHIDKYYTLD